MQAVVVNDGELRIEDRPDPEAGPGDVVVTVRAAGLNAADLLQRLGFYPAPPGWPADIPGLEFAGEVRQLGAGVTNVTLGQRVCAVVGGGAQATMCVVPAEHLIPVPHGIEITSAGGFAEAFTTAYDALVRQAHLAKGERVLISGAAGGVGCAAVQIARAWGATVVAATRDDRHHARLKLLGADEVITSAEVGDVAPVQVVLELVGAAHLVGALPILATGARVVVIGVGAGSKIEVDLLSVMTKRLVITGSTLRSRSRSEKAQIVAEMIHDLVPHWARNDVHVPVSLSYRLVDVARAYESFAAAGKFGKILLTTH